MDRAMHFTARMLALLGGMVLLALVLSTTLSIIGRNLNSIGHSDALAHIGWLASLLQLPGPVQGDYELVEAGMAITIFAFLGWCQISRAHATVDFFANFLGRRLNAILSLLWEIILTGFFLIVTWRIAIATSEKLRYGETTFLLQMPVWWSYAVCTIFAAIVSCIGLYTVRQRFQDLHDREEPDNR